MPFEEKLQRFWQWSTQHSHPPSGPPVLLCAGDKRASLFAPNCCFPTAHYHPPTTHTNNALNALSAILHADDYVCQEISIENVLVYSVLLNYCLNYPITHYSNSRYLPFYTLMVLYAKKLAWRIIIGQSSLPPPPSITTVIISLLSSLVCLATMVWLSHPMHCLSLLSPPRAAKWVKEDINCYFDSIRSSRPRHLRAVCVTC